MKKPWPGLPILMVSMLLIPLSGAAQTFQVEAGYTRSDVGLYNNGDGFMIGAGLNVLTSDGPVDLTVTLEYVLRGGSQPRYFSDPDAGLVLGDAEVKLHYLQPAAFVGWTLSMGKVGIRPYAGFSLALKLSENWTQPTGETSGEYSYEDTDFLGHAGITVGLSPVFLDARFSFGFNGQLIDGTFPAGGKAAEDPAAGVGSAEDGAKISGFQAGLGVKF